MNPTKSEESEENVNPILVETSRGGRRESWHRGAAVLVKHDGTQSWSVGDCDTPLFPRSAVKAIQALALVESGAAEAFMCSPEDLAVVQASHSGEPRHIEQIEGMLARADLSPEDLECGAHRPSNREAANTLLLSHQSFQAIHNNCSGKHAGMLLTARHLGLPTKGYIHPDHPVQALIRDMFQDLFGASDLMSECGIDGCSVPTYAVSLKSMALGMARFGNGEALCERRARAAREIYDAAVAHPFLVAGTGRFCTHAMDVLGDQALIKTGAEGVFCASFRDKGYGLAVKCDDGATRASEAVMAAILNRLYPNTVETLPESKPVKNWRGFETGRTYALSGVLKDLSLL